MRIQQVLLFIALCATPLFSQGVVPHPPRGGQKTKPTGDLPFCTVVIGSSIDPPAKTEDTRCKGGIPDRICASTVVSAFMLCPSFWADAYEISMPASPSPRVKVQAIAIHEGSWSLTGYHQGGPTWRATTEIQDDQDVRVFIDGIGPHVAVVKVRATSSTGHAHSESLALIAKGEPGFGIQAGGVMLAIGHTTDQDEDRFRYDRTLTKDISSEIVYTNTYAKEIMSISAGSFDTAHASASNDWNILMDSGMDCSIHKTRGWFQFWTRSNYRGTDAAPNSARWVTFDGLRRAGNDWTFATPTGPDLSQLPLNWTGN